MTRPDAAFRKGLPDKPDPTWAPYLKESERYSIFNAWLTANINHRRKRFEDARARADACPIPTNMGAWTASLNDDQWPHMRFVEVLFATQQGCEWQMWTSRSAEDLFRQEVFWTLRFDTMRRHDDRTKGRMPITWREVTHDVVWC